TMGFLTESWHKNYLAGTANSDNTFIQQTMPVDRLVGFYGATRPAVGPISYLKFQLGSAKIKDIWQFDEINNTDTNTVIANSPVMYNRQEQILINAYVTTLGASVLKLLGRTAEPVGKVIMAGSR
ncbi:hypothetical protein LCGC14_2921250, partial [marine sediment metagenome]